MVYNHFLRRMGIMLTIAENSARTIRLNAGPSARRENRAA
jgi:hypothetical protein